MIGLANDISANHPYKRIMPIPSNECVPLSLSSFQINAVNPGFKLGIDWNLSEVKKNQNRLFSKKSKGLSKQLYLNGSIALGVQPTTNTNFLTSVEIGRRRMRNNKWYVTPSIGLGLLVKINSGETWKVDVNGNVTEVRKTARAYIAPILSYEFGRQIHLTKSQFSVFSRITSYSALGINSTIVPELALELGFRVVPNFSFKRQLHPVLFK
jgi:hypothetical protein